MQNADIVEHEQTKQKAVVVRSLVAQGHVASRRRNDARRVTRDIAGLSGRHYRAGKYVLDETPNRGFRGDDMNETLQIEDFKPHVGKIVRFKGTRYAIPLDHIAHEDAPPPKGTTRKPFMLIFRGPKETEVMPEGLYECEFEGGPTCSLHVIPIFTPRPDRQDYQSVFN
jgi:hypothetical protein